MNLGLLVPATAETSNITTIAQRLESLGFESLWIPEHPVIPVDFKTQLPGGGTLPAHYRRWADPFIALTMAASATKKIKLATGICLLPERNALMTAKVIASLDMYSGGRIILGVGAGWLKEETEIMGANFRLRWKLLRETTEAMRVCWTQAQPSYQGELVQFPPVYCDPKPAQKSGPPIFLGGHVQKALERVARTYDGWCPLTNDPADYGKKVATIRQLAKECGRDPEALQMTAFVDPQNGALSADALKAYRDAGASRLVLFSQEFAKEIADGKALECIDRVAPIVERAQKI
ncbi:MAG TPA: LLM class F420-dependent oxidoreductase [Methylomirabilota bacterium]|nr:LLM class F420-dependent oxidoreductase [Methylomirabilota bacterium]